MDVKNIINRVMLLLDADWQQSEHKRDKSGKFTSMGGQSGGSSQGSSESQSSGNTQVYQESTPVSHQQRSKDAVKNWQSGSQKDSSDVGNTERTNDMGQIITRYYQNDRSYYQDRYVKERQDWVQKALGCTRQQAQRFQRAICGDESSVGQDGHVQKPGWSRHGDTAIRMLSNDWAKQQAQAMHEYILRMPKHEGQVFRGIVVSPQDAEAFKQGDIFQENGTFSSWSSKQGVADEFAITGGNGKVSVIIHMQNPKYGASIMPLSYYPDQSQVLVSNMECRRRKISKVQRISDRKMHVYLQQD